MMETSVESVVQKVTVYPDRARVTAAGQCDLETGLQRLLLDELPLTLEPDSVRVSGSGTARVRILSVDVTRRYYEETPAAKVRDLQEQIEQVRDEMRILGDDKAGWTTHGKYLDGLREATAEFAKGLSRGKTTVADQSILISFLQEQDGQMRTAVRDLDKQQQELKKRLEKLLKEIKQLQSSRPKERFQAQVEVEVLAAGNFTPEVSYVVRKAGWQPLYDVRLQAANGDHTVEMEVLAQITQNSGQDWLGVALTVSTARPSLNQRLPELTPWYVDVYTPPAPMPRVRTAKPALTAAPTAVMADMPVPQAAPADALVVNEAEIVTATAEREGTAVTFRIPGGTDIPSDGSPHKNSLQQFNLDPKLDYLCVPKHTDAIYRRATVTNNSDSPLLAGQANLFVGDDYIGRTQIKYTPANGEIELLLGVEERLTVERELVKRDVDKKMLRDERRVRYGYKIELKNLLAETAAVEVHDHIPVARHEKIKIKLDGARPSPTEQSDLNLLEWHLTLAANSEERILYEFLLEYPRSLQIMGIHE
ncbi:MAG: mucoidy inhibitor MuiA family protein [Chloroflexi bacterium]|nr:mucoidy inhibitor MuiA family protein [Chloroflexota bacterium]